MDFLYKSARNLIGADRRLEKFVAEIGAYLKLQKSDTLLTDAHFPVVGQFIP